MSQPSSKASQVFEFNTHELPRRAGEMKEYQLDLEILEPIGVPLVSVPAGDVIEVDLRLESVTEGVLLSADLYAIAKGECTRCLDPVEITVERKIQEGPSCHNKAPEILTSATQKLFYSFLKI
jgi:uncharacterized protein